jgi:hypothetical protein
MAVDQNFVPDETAADADAQFESMRSEPRDSMFLLATVRRAGSADVQVKVRNLSAGGMMAESPVSFSRGDVIEADLRGIGVVTGKIAWTAGGRVGGQCDTQVDPRLARKAVSGNPQPQLVRPSRTMWRPSIR